MPRTPRRRPPTRRTLPPRPVIERAHSASTAAVAASQAPTQGASARRGVGRGLSERDARLLIADMKRVAVVSGTCLGLLAVLVAVDRLV